MLGRILTPAERRWCNAMCLSRGFDDDDEDKIQYSHVVVPPTIETGASALCKSDRLWFSGGKWDRTRMDGVTKVEEDNRVTCQACADILARLVSLPATDPELVALVDTAVRHERERIWISLLVENDPAAEMVLARDRDDAEEEGRPHRPYFPSDYVSAKS